MIRVAVADDSAFTCRLLASYLECAGDCEVVGTAHDAASTIGLVCHTAPDVLTLDLEMPGAGGLDLLRRIVSETSAAVVIVSGVSRRAAATTLKALELGAVDVVMKYTPGAPVSPATLRREVVSKVRTAAAARQHRARASLTDDARAALWRTAVRPSPRARRALTASTRRGVIVIGASTGGPGALRELVAELPADFRTPCVVVQHLPAAFTAAFAAELGRYARLPVHEADAGVRLAEGSIVVAPGSRHLLLLPYGRLELRRAAGEELYQPSIDFTMVSAAESYGASSVGVVLTGMGSDGAEGLKRVRQRGGEAYVQDPAVCVIDSMPLQALERAGADFVGGPGVIGAMLARRERSS